MNAGERKPWTRDELILAINLYCKIPFGRIHMRNPDIINLANRLGRSPGSVSYKLANFAHIDPTIERKGASNVSKLDRETWNEFFNDWDSMAFESEMLVAKMTEGIDTATLRKGETKAMNIKVRVNQNFFRKMILSSYNNTCCITGIDNVELLVSSHIVPWANDEKNRMNPTNGLCLNALHDRAFDKGLITIDEKYKIIVSKKVNHKLIKQYNQKSIILPNRFLPDQQFLSFHRNNIFQEY